MKQLRGVIIGLWLAIMAVSAVMAAAPGPETLLGQHTVRRGETLFCIARVYGVDPWAIASRNGLVHVNQLHAGLVLQIPNTPRALPAGPVCERQFSDGALIPQPTPAPTCACARTHLIVTGDTLTAIGLKYGVSTWSLATCNRLQNPNYIRIGDMLCVP